MERSSLHRPTDREMKDEEFKPGDSAYSFTSNNRRSFVNQQVVQSSTSPIRFQDSMTPNQQNQASEMRGRTNSDYGSRSRSRSGYRKMSQSPIQVNTSYEISQKNTENLWNEFRSKVREHSSSKKSRQDVQDQDYNSQYRPNRQPLRHLQTQPQSQLRREERLDSGSSNRDDDLGNRKQSNTSYMTTKHMHQVSVNSNVDTNKFIDTTKSEDKNRLLPESHLRKLIQVSGKETKKSLVSLRENISFDKNTQVLSGRRPNDSATNKLSHASQFTFNSTEKLQSQDLGTFRNKELEEISNRRFIAELNNEPKSRIKIFSQPNTFGDRSTSLEKKEFPIMNSVRQILQSKRTKETPYAFEPPSSLKTVESKDSTKTIRDRLKNKIDALREKISNSHKDTMRSIQDKLSVPINRIADHNDKEQHIDTTRVYSRDGSKFIEGSGLELDDYVASCDDINSIRKTNHFDRLGHQSSKYETFNSMSNHQESVRSANTFQSRGRENGILLTGKDRNNSNRLNVTAENSKNHTFNNTKAMDNYFTIEDVENPRECLMPAYHQSYDSFTNEAVTLGRNSASKPLNQIRSFNSTNNVFKFKKTLRSNSKKPTSSSKGSRVADSSIITKSHSKRSRSSNKIKPYPKPWRKCMVRSQKRLPRSNKLNKTENLRIKENNSFYAQNDCSQDEESNSQEESSGSLYQTQDPRNEKYNDVGMVRAEYVNIATIPRSKTRSTSKENSSILFNNVIKKVDISPNRSKRAYKKSRKPSINKPPILPYYRTQEKQRKAQKTNQLPPKYKRPSVARSNEKNLSGLLRSKTRDLDNDDKVTRKIFKQIAECLEILNDTQNYNK